MLLTLKLLALEPGAGAALPAGARRRRRRGAGRHRLHPAHRRRGADGPRLHRRLARPRRHRAGPGGADSAAGRGRRARRAAALARIAGRPELPAQLRGDHRDRRPARASAHPGAAVAPRRGPVRTHRPACCSASSSPASPSSSRWCRSPCSISTAPASTAPLANVIAIPLTTFVIMPLEALALLFDLAGLGAPFWWLAGQALAFLLWLAHAAADAPGRGRAAAGDAARRLRPDGRRRPVDLPVADALAAAGAWPRSPPAPPGRSPRPRPT